MLRYLGKMIESIDRYYIYYYYCLGKWLFCLSCLSWSHFCLSKPVILYNKAYKAIGFRRK